MPRRSIVVSSETLRGQFIQMMMRQAEIQDTLFNWITLSGHNYNDVMTKLDVLYNIASELYREALASYPNETIVIL